MALLLIGALFGGATATYGAYAKFVKGPGPKNCYTSDPPKIQLESECVALKTTMLVPNAAEITQNPPVAVVNETEIRITPMRFLANGRVTENQIRLGEDPQKDAAALDCICKQGPISLSKQDSLTTGQCHRMECTVGYNGQLYVEASGGRGAGFDYFAQDGNDIFYEGGSNGTVFGTLVVKKGNVLDIQFGFNAEKASAANINSATYPKTPGGGGSGTLLAGSNGGGATSVVLLDSNSTANPSPLLVGAGGGGAGRNASGGPAGSSNLTEYLKPVKLPVGLGFAGGPLNVEKPSKFELQFKPYQLSGGGGSFESGGRSILGSAGTFLEGGSSNPEFCGGGGGGSGFPGGGAGSWNQILKPGNLQGAGGGGCSFVDANSVLFGSIDGESVCIWDRNISKNSNIVVPASSYIVFGFPKTI